jgi:hypothetical protein
MMLVEVDMESLHTDALLSAVGFTSVWVFNPCCRSNIFPLRPRTGQEIDPWERGI